MIRALSVTRWVVVGLVLAALIIPALFTFVTGLKIVAVDGESMTPTYQLGDVVLIGPVTPADLQAGHVVTVQSPDGSMYTHRILKVDDDGMLELKGDGNEVADPVPVNPESVIGAIRGHIDQPAATLLQFGLTLPARIFLALTAVALTFLPIRRGLVSELKRPAKKSSDSPDVGSEGDADATGQAPTPSARLDDVRPPLSEALVTDQPQSTDTQTRRSLRQAALETQERI